MNQCKKCNAILDDGAIFCDECGTVQESKSICACGFTLENNFLFCPECGKRKKPTSAKEKKKKKELLYKERIKGIKNAIEKFAHDGFDVDDNSYGPILCQAITDEKLDIVEALLEYGANIDEYDDEDNTALLNACITNNNALIKLVLKYNPDVDYENLSGQNALAIARENKNRYIVGLLHKAGAEDPDDDDTSSDYSSSSSGCYITTATCQSFGKADDCYELTQFRNFRDNWLKQQSDGNYLIKKYYATAPAIVAKINTLPNSVYIYKSIYKNFLQPALTFIEQGKNKDAKNLYVKMVKYLTEKY